MAERVAAGRDVTTPSTGPRSDPAGPPIRPCWVTGGRGRLPGLLLEWRQRPDGWHGRVVHAVEDEGGWTVVEEWLPAGLLTPA